MISCVRTKRCGWHSEVAAATACPLAVESLASAPWGESPSFWEMASFSDVGAAARNSCVVPALPPQAARAPAAAREEKSRKTFIYLPPESVRQHDTRAAKRVKDKEQGCR